VGSDSIHRREIRLPVQDSAARYRLRPRRSVRVRCRGAHRWQRQAKQCRRIFPS